MYNVETDDIIGQYIIFCHVMDEQLKNSREMKTVIEASRICQNRNVLKKNLKEREKEVVNIMIELFNQESAVNEYGEERREEDWKKGIEEGVQLFAKLFELGNPEELEKALKDPEYRKKLLKDYGLAED